MKLFQTRTFERKYKKLKRRELDVINQAISRIIEDPNIGEVKKGDLRDIRVHKEKHKNEEFLVAYWLSKQETIELIDFGVHENFYRDLKRRMT
ncbi:MAG: type II toxin-antitoxin system RelE/ParE family toxin [Actinobacteria bacterium]|nr:type II toxin-antitoxin system RelE/ParE family toxin [Actinomycetota bacterium]